MELTNYFPYIISRAAGELGIFRAKVLKEFDINLREWRVLVALGEQDGQRVTDLSRFSLTEVSTLSRSLDIMEKRGLVEKRRVRPNSRYVTVHIKPVGRRVLEGTIPDAMMYQKTVLEGIGQKDLLITQQVLEQIYKNALLHELQPRGARASAPK